MDIEKQNIHLPEGTGSYQIGFVFFHLLFGKFLMCLPSMSCLLQTLVLNPQRP